jgi:hypothetical protein
MHVRPCHLGPAQLRSYEPANRNQNATYSEQKEGPRQTYRTARVGQQILKRVEGCTIPIAADIIRVGKGS